MGDFKRQYEQMKTDVYEMNEEYKELKKAFNMLDSALNDAVTNGYYVSPEFSDYIEQIRNKHVRGVEP